LWKTWNNPNVVVTGSKVSSTEIVTASQDQGTWQYYAKLTIPANIPLGNNCVIALVDNNNNIWWTWHLWITDYNPDSASDKKGQTHKYFSEAFTPAGLYAGKRMMDRNLGATITGIANDYVQKQLETTTEAVKWYGLMYQWGRKDPFTNSSTGTTNIAGATPIYNAENTKIEVNNAAVNVGKDWEGNNISTEANGNSVDGFPKINNAGVPKYRVIDAIINPMHYYHSGVSNDWTEQDNNLWQMTVKTVFDPCPPGWRVPAGGATAAYNPWSGFGNGLFNSTTNVTYENIWKIGSSWDVTTDIGPFPWKAQISTEQPGTAGRLYGASATNPSGALGYSGSDTPWYGGDNSVAWYPASGYRSSASGVFTTTGSYGFFWSCAVTGSDVYYLRLDLDAVYPTRVSSRALGFPVRCVQVLLTCFA
jgi:hypothetical protein